MQILFKYDQRISGTRYYAGQVVDLDDRIAEKLIYNEVAVKADVFQKTGEALKSFASPVEQAPQEKIAKKSTSGAKKKKKDE